MKALIIEQKITAFANQYPIYEMDGAGAKGALLAFAHQKRLAIKEKIEFFSDANRSSLAFSVQAEKALDIHGKFFVSDASGAPIGAMRKAFKSSLLRSTWEILDDQDRPAIIIQEHSKALAIFRRLWQFIPYVGDFPFILKYHFDFFEPASNNVLAKYLKTKLLYDHYKLEIVNDKFDGLDWRVVAAQCVMLDALQGR